MTYLIGCDPEIFLKDTLTNRFISAHGIIEGDKLNPLPVERGAIQVDGTALEFNINPASNVKDFRTNIEEVMKQLEARVRERRPELKFAIVPVAKYTERYFNIAIPEKAKELGCEPDYNAYTKKENPKPDVNANFRTASGHIHVGWTEGEDPFDASHFEDCCIVTRQLDNILLPCSKRWDKDTQRRKLYGAKGAFRPKPYGCEYRVLSNVWLSDPDLIEWVYNATQVAMELLDKNIKVEFPYDPEALHRYYKIPRLPARYRQQ